MSSVQEILDAINALEHIEEEEYVAILDALRILAEDCGIDTQAKRSVGNAFDFDDDDEDLDDDDDEEDDY